MAQGKAKIRHVVQCIKHGNESKFWQGRMVAVPAPVHKRDRNAGCPVCAAEQRRELSDTAQTEPA